MFSTTHSPQPHMMAHASSADAPFDSEVSTADLDSEVLVTALSATPSPASSPSPTPSVEALQLDMLSQLMDVSTSSTSSITTTNCALLADHSIIAVAATTSSPSISPLVLKLESPQLKALATPTPRARATARKSKSQATEASVESTTPRRRSNVDPADKEAKARERVLRNRAAAQESRDKKRKYVADIETSNQDLQDENTQLLKRLKTVEDDNLLLSQRIETLMAQFAQMQQQLALASEKQPNNESGAGFCQSAVLAKEDKEPFRRGELTNSMQQRPVPPKRSLFSNSLKAASPAFSQRRRLHSMTMTNFLVTKNKISSKDSAPCLDPSAAQNRTEICCRPFCTPIRGHSALTLSSAAAASFPARVPQLAMLHMMLLHAMSHLLLPQLMLNFSTLFLISTGPRLNCNNSSNSSNRLSLQERQLRQVALSFIRRQRLFSSRPPLRPSCPSKPEKKESCPKRLRFSTTSKSIPSTSKNIITSLNPMVIEEIVTKFRQGRKDVARRLLVKALLLSEKDT
ncbi:hypothetical protein BGW38_005346 [Lunasporangiospora selenospora]|uniref:BZIP domain-containing protein n=1 Tax=Lunasporangiospora selenospora TaxID=979761 RepID=A0A9P6FQ15_9FUNG|nr:hypothetical protein BGW38_005346 [Lunasporangiospora selenospora]